MCIGLRRVRAVSRHEDVFRNARAFEVNMFSGQPVLHIYKIVLPEESLDLRTRQLKETCIGATSVEIRNNYMLALEQHRSLQAVGGLDGVRFEQLW